MSLVRLDSEQSVAGRALTLLVRTSRSSLGLDLQGQGRRTLSLGVVRGLGLMVMTVARRRRRAVLVMGCGLMLDCRLLTDIFNIDYFLKNRFWFVTMSFWGKVTFIRDTSLRARAWKHLLRP